MITECGVIGLFSINKKTLIKDAVDGLQCIQHRGQDSCGIVYTINDELNKLKDYGLVKNVFTGTEYENILNLKINSIIGHVRYTTSGSKIKKPEYIQPKIYKKEFAVSFNGNLPDIKKIYPDITLDTDGIIRYISDSKSMIKENIIEFQKKIPGVYCLIIIYKNELYITRDRYGLRPLSIGIHNNNSYCIASETVVLENLKYSYLREVNPGEVLKIGYNGLEILYQHSSIYETKCLFEYIYFLRPNSLFGDINANNFRENCGKELALNDREFLLKNRDNIIVVGCPNSGICSAVEYASVFNLQYKQVIKRNIGSNRTFILSSNKERIDALKKKYNLDRDNIKDKIIILIDDSVVRGNTLSILLDQINDCKPKELHIRIAAPPVISQCYFGIDIPTKEELIYNTKNSEEKLVKHYNVTSFKYLNLDFIDRLFNSKLCTSCFTGKYNNKLLEW